MGLRKDSIRIAKREPTLMGSLLFALFYPSLLVLRNHLSGQFLFRIGANAAAPERCCAVCTCVSEL